MDDVLHGVFGGGLRFAQLQEQGDAAERYPGGGDGVAEEGGCAAPDKGREKAFGGPH